MSPLTRKNHVRRQGWSRLAGLADAVATGRDALPRDPASHVKLVGTRSCAIRHRTSEKGEHLVKMMGKSLSSDSARARSQKQQKEACETCSAGRAGAHPYQRRRSRSVLSFLYRHSHRILLPVLEIDRRSIGFAASVAPGKAGRLCQWRISSAIGSPVTRVNDPAIWSTGSLGRPHESLYLLRLPFQRHPKSDLLARDFYRMGSCW